MDNKAYIKAISYYLPDAKLGNEAIAKDFPEWEVDKISAKTGIMNRHWSADTETSGDMAVKAAEKLFTEHQIDKKTIDYIILCTQSPDYFLPTTACIVQNKLELNTNIGAFDMNLGCSGFVYGLGLAKGLIVSGQAKNILFLTSETYTKFLHPQDKSNKTIFGDAAAATLISLEGFGEILNFEYGTDGKGANNLIVKNGGLRNFKKTSIETIDEYNNTISDDYLYMNGPEIFAFTLSAVPELLRNTLVKNNLKQEEVDLFIFHQANRYMLQHLRKKIQIPEDKFFIFMENCGNTVSSTIPIAIYEAQKKEQFSNNFNVLLAGFGVGYSWAGTVLKIK